MFKISDNEIKEAAIQQKINVIEKYQEIQSYMDFFT